MEVASTHGVPMYTEFGLADYKMVKGKTSETLHFLQLFEEKALKYHIIMSKLIRNWFIAKSMKYIWKPDCVSFTFNFPQIWQNYSTGN